MFDMQLVAEILGNIQTAILRIERRCSTINTPSGFLKDDEGIDRLDGICMMLIAIGERVKILDKITNGLLLNKYRDVDWKGV
jgi:hypothetical protein